MKCLAVVQLVMLPIGAAAQATVAFHVRRFGSKF